MNHRLLSREEKEKNYQGRLHRNKMARRAKRRTAVIESLAKLGFPSHLAAGIFSCDEAAHLQFSHLARSKNLIRKTNRNAVLFSWETPTLPSIPEEEKKVVPAPTRQLQKSRRGPLPGCYTGPAIPRLAEPISSSAKVEILRNDRSLRSACRLRVLEFTMKLLKSPIHSSAQFVEERLDGGPYTEEEIENLTRLTAFQNTFEKGRMVYAIAVRQEGLAVAAGDWGFFEHDWLFGLLKGLRLPARMHRKEYLARLHSNEFEGPIALDLYSLNYAPLIHCDLTCPRKRVPHREPKEFPDFVRDLAREARESEELWRDILGQTAEGRLKLASGEWSRRTSAPLSQPSGL